MLMYFLAIHLYLMKKSLNSSALNLNIFLYFYTELFLGFVQMVTRLSHIVNKVYHFCNLNEKEI